MALDFLSPLNRIMKTSDYNNHIVKCGEITLINKRKISFTCNFCVREVFSIGSFIKHILRKHLIFSRADIDALLVEAKSKHTKVAREPKNNESIECQLQQQQQQQHCNATDDVIDSNGMEDEIGTHELDDSKMLKSSEFVNSDEYSCNSLEFALPTDRMEDDDPNANETFIEDENEEFALLEEFFEKLPSFTTEGEVEKIENSNKIQASIAPIEHEKKVMLEEKVVHDVKVEHDEKVVQDGLQEELKGNCNEPGLSKLVYVEQALATAPPVSITPSMPIGTKQIVFLCKPVRHIAPILQPTSIIPNNTSELNPNSFICEICKKIFRTKPLLISHYQQHNKIKTKGFTCEYCDSKFSSKSNLNVHVKRHLGIKPYTCSYCDMAFTSSTEAKLHMIKHTGSKMYKCTQCDQQFSRQFQLKLHCRRHANERPYACLTCGNTFYDSQRLRSHEATHSKLKPFSCDICNATFKYLKSLREHSKLHLDVKEYQCKLCDKSFAQNAGLYSHMKTHGAKKAVKKR